MYMCLYMYVYLWYSRYPTDDAIVDDEPIRGLVSSNHANIWTALDCIGLDWYKLDSLHVSYRYVLSASAYFYALIHASAAILVSYSKPPRLKKYQPSFDERRQKWEKENISFLPLLSGVSHENRIFLSTQIIYSHHNT